MNTSTGGAAAAVKQDLADDTRVLIWSGKHGKWWAANMRGYTENIRTAGIYEIRDARGIVIEAQWSPNRICDLEGRWLEDEPRGNAGPYTDTPPPGAST